MKQEHKCPNGKGYYKPTGESGYIHQVSCVTCPTNCMECHIIEGDLHYFCKNKWTANKNVLYSATAGDYSIPECAVMGCEVCERTPCDKCQDGLVVHIEKNSIDSISTMNGTEYSCVSVVSPNKC